jgi:predicted enzyme related to lactoylglutathione lyase
MNLNSVMIGSEDAKRLADYYTQLFGEPDWSEQGFTGWQLGAGSLTVGPHDEVKGSNADPGRIICNIETADVRGEFERVEKAGAIVVREPYEMELTLTGLAFGGSIVLQSQNCNPVLVPFTFRVLVGRQTKSL